MFFTSLSGLFSLPFTFHWRRAGNLSGGKIKNLPPTGDWDGSRLKHI
jgi:hypothetical protein